MMSVGTGFIFVVLMIFPFLNAGESNVADVVISFTPLALWLLMRLNRKAVKSHLTLLELSFLTFVVLFFVFGLVSTIRSISIIESVFKFNQELALLILILTSLPILANRRFLSRLTTVLIFVAMILSLISIYFLLPGTKRGFADISFFYVTHGHNHLADYLLLIVPVALFKAFFLGRHRLFYRLSLFFILAAFLLTFSRFSWLVLALLPIVIYLINPLFFKQRFIFKISVLGISLTLFIVILALAPAWINSSINGANRAIQKPYLGNLLIKPIYLLPRLTFISHAIKQFKGSPWFGFGPGTFQYVSRAPLVNIGGTVYAHSLPFQLLYETGLFGLAIYISGLSFFIIAALRSIRRSDQLGTASLAGVFLSLIHAQLDFDWQISAVRLTAWFLLLATIAPTHTLQKNSSDWVPRRILIIPCLLPVLFTVFVFVNPLFNRGEYKRRVEISDQEFDYATSQKLLNLWSRLDWGNGEMFSWMAQRHIDQGKMNQAVADFMLASSAVLHPTITIAQANVFLDDFLSTSPTLSPTEMVDVLEVLNRAYFPHDFFWYSPYEYQKKIYETIDRIPRSDDFGLDGSKGGLVSYWRYLTALLTDNKRFDIYQDFIDAAARADPDQIEYRRISSINRQLSENDNDPFEIKKSIAELVLVLNVGQKDVYRYLLSYLYTALADSYNKRGLDNEEIDARIQAIDVLPSLGSAYLTLAQHYQMNRQSEKMENILAKCQERVSIDCRSWFVGFNRKRPSDAY